MPSHGRRRRDSWSEDEGTSISGRNTAANAADPQGMQGDGHAAPGPSPTNSKSGGGWSVGPFHAYFPTHEEQALRGRAAVFQGSPNERGSSTATPETSIAAVSRYSLPTSGANGAAGVGESDQQLHAGEEGEVPARDCYFPPDQDNGDDDKDTFVDKGSAAALDVPAEHASTFAVGGGGAAAAAAATSGSVAATNMGAAMTSVKRTGKVRPAVTAHGPPSSVVVGGGGGVSSTPTMVTSGLRFGSGGTTGTPSPSGSYAMAAASGGGSGGNTGVAAFSSLTPASTAAYTSAGNTAATSGTGAREGANALAAPTTVAVSSSGAGGQATRLSTSAGASPQQHATATTNNNTTPLRRGAPGKSGTNNPSNAPQYSRLNSSEAAPGVVYRATLAVRAMAMDPEQPVLWAAVGDDPIAALRIDSGELTHSKSVKDIEQVHCMAVVRIAEESGTTFKSASASPRGASSTPKMTTPKTGRRGKKSGRRSTSTRKSGRPGSGTGGLLTIKNADADRDGDSDSDDDGNGQPGSPVGGRDRPRFSNYLWCGLSRGHMAVVNMATLEYQVIHNAHMQTVNRIWYWEARNKVWSAGREKGVHVWDPQRRVILKKRNIAAILTDATYADGVDKVFAVAGDPCVRVFEPGGENVNVPKGQENRIKMKSDASVIAYHRNSGLVWVGLARGSVLMSPVSMDVERTLPFTFSAILFQGEHAILAGQESPNGENRLMVLDLSNPRDPYVLAYTKFANPLQLGIHVIPHTRFAIVAQDDPKKGIVVVIFVHTGTATLTHAVTPVSRYPEQRTERVIRGPTAASAFPAAQQQLALTSPDATEAAGALAGHASPHNVNPATNNNGAATTNNNHNGTVVMVDRTSLHRAAVVKCAPEPRADRKFNVEADHSTLVEAIGPEAQEIKSALKHLVKTTDEVRQSLVQQRSAEATLADFSRLLRSRQQWLMEQGPITHLPVLPPAVAETINRDYVTPEGKTIATAVEQLQQMYAKVQLKLQQHQQQQQQQQRQSPNSALLTVNSPTAAARLSPSFSSPLAPGYMSGGGGGPSDSSGLTRPSANDERRAPSFPDADASSSNNVNNNTLPCYPSVPPLGGGGGNDATLPMWASQLAATLQRERVLHEQQLGALQLKMERLTERNAALSNAFARVQAHVAALGQQSLSALELDSADSTTVVDPDELGGVTQRHALPLLSSQHEAAVALFAQLGRGKYHKPKYVRHSTEALVRAVDEVVRLTTVKSSRSRERDALGGTAVMHHSSSVVLGSAVAAAAAASATGDDVVESSDPLHSLSQAPRYRGTPSPAPTSPLAGFQARATQDLSGVVGGAGVGQHLHQHSSSGALQGGIGGAAADRMALLDLPVSSFRGLSSIAEAELYNLRTLNEEVASFWARLQNTASESDTNATAAAMPVSQEQPTESCLALLSLAPKDVGASPALLHLMASRVLQSVCWAECAQTVLRELTSASGLENPFVAGGVHNALVSARTIGTGLGGVACGDNQDEWWRQGPLQVLDYESAQERVDILHSVSQLRSSGGMELVNTSRIRETLLARCLASKECTLALKESTFHLHRLPGALWWSQSSLRHLFNLLESADEMLIATAGGGSSSTVEAAIAAAGKNGSAPHRTGPPPSQADVATRTASAVGVAMTHWALFLINLRADLLAVHYATRLFHAWCWGTVQPPPPLPAAPSAAKPVRAATNATQPSQKATTDEVIAPAVPLADAAMGLTSKGKLLLLYMQWCFPAFGSASDVSVGTGSGGGNGGAAASLQGAPNSASANVNMPLLFTGDGENDVAAAVTVQRSTAECSAMLADVVVLTAQLLRRVELLLSYCHAIRGHALTALEGSGDAAVARVATFMGPPGSADVEARLPTEQERAFLRSEPRQVAL